MKTLMLGILISTLDIAHGGQHEAAMSSVSSFHSYTSKIRTHNLEYEISYFSLANSTHKSESQKVVTQTTQHISLDFKNKKQCKSLKLTVYEVPFQTLNDRDIMSFIHVEKGYLIDGLYDTTYAMPGNASIFVAPDIGRQTLIRVLSPEIAPYLHDIMCLSEATEPFAIKYEIDNDNPLK